MKKIILTFLFLLPAISFAFSKNSAIVVGDNVRVRSAPDLQGRILTSLNTGSIVEIIDKTKEPVRLIKSREFFYHWYQIKYKKGKTGWIYGQFLYKYESNNRYPEIVINKKHFQFLVFSEQDIQYDMPSESTYSFPCFYNAEKKKTYPIYKPHIGGVDGLPDFLNDSNSYSSFYRLEGNTGGHIQVKDDIYQKGNIIYLPVEISFQDGSASAALVIRYENDRFTITDFKEASSY